MARRTHNIAQSSPSNSQETRSESASEESSDEQSLSVLSELAAKVEQCEDGHADDDNVASSVQLTERRPDQGTETEAEDVEGETKDCDFITNVKVSTDVCNGTGVAFGSVGGTEADDLQLEEKATQRVEIAITNVNSHLREFFHVYLTISPCSVGLSLTHGLASSPSSQSTR